MTESILATAAEHIRSGWTQGEIARDARRNSCAATSPHACYFCAVGAVVRTVEDLPDHSEREAAYTHAFMRLEQVIRAPEHPSAHVRITAWNDQPGRTAEEVLEAFAAAADLDNLPAGTIAVCR